MDTLSIALVELDIIWENPEANFDLLNDKLKNIKADIFLLPEMFSTGFTMKPNEFAEPFCGESFKFLQTMAINKNAVFVSTIPTKQGSSYFNRMYWIEPNETFSIYDKRHLFSLAGENNYYKFGEDRKVINYQDWSFLPQICYDLRFPVWARNDVNYDAIFYLANWPEKRIYAWTQLLKARAIENQAYAIGVNRVGIDGNGYQHNGQSMIYDALGQEVAHENIEGILIFEVDKRYLQKIRKKFNFLQDQDKFEIKI